MNEHTSSADNLRNNDIDLNRVNERSDYGSVNPADLPMPDPAAANAKAREIYEANHPKDEDDAGAVNDAGGQAFNPSTINLAADRRDVNRAPNRANEATDPNDTGSGGMPAGGVKSGSSLQ